MYGQRTVGLYDPQDSKRAQWYAGGAARDAGMEMDRWHAKFAEEEDAAKQAAAARQAEADQMARAQYGQQMANQRAQYDAFQAEEKRKQELHSKSMKERPDPHAHLKQQMLIETQNRPAMAMAEQFGNMFGQGNHTPNMNLYDNTGKRIGGSYSSPFGPFKKSLMG